MAVKVISGLAESTDSLPLGLNISSSSLNISVVWHSGSALVSINEVNLQGPVCTVMGDHVRVQFLVPDIYLCM